MSEPVVVFRTHSDIEAAVVRGLLDSHGLKAFLSSNMPQMILPLALRGLGEVRVSVPAGEAEAARQLIADFRREAQPPEVVVFPDDLFGLEARLGHRFENRALLELALTHRSRAHEADDHGDPGAARHNESLEFLGDAVLGLVVADFLYREFPDLDEGQKSKIRAALVAKASLAALAERLDLGTVVRLGRGEEKTGGRQKQALLADTCEAVIAALYLEAGLSPVRALLRFEWGPLLERVRRPGLLTAMTGDYKSALQEWLQARNDEPPVYRIVAESGPDHRKRFDIEVVICNRAVGRAEGASKKEAEQGAARAALIAVGALDE